MGDLRVPAGMVNESDAEAVLVHLASGIGNIVLATPLLIVLARDGFTVDVLIDADYPGVGELLEGWSRVRSVSEGRARRPHASYSKILAAIPPFYWGRYASRYASMRTALFRPPDSLFYRNEQLYYLEFARALGCDASRPPHYHLPVAPDWNGSARVSSVVLAPGCKTGEMASKRWPFFAELADRFEDVVLVGTRDDLRHFNGDRIRFPQHVRSLIGRLSLRETAAVIAGAGVVVANDSGLGHVAGALGVPTILLFGPTSHLALGALPPNVIVMRRGLACEPCWFNQRFRKCDARIYCLHEITADEVADVLSKHRRTCVPY